MPEGTFWKKWQDVPGMNEKGEFYDSFTPAHDGIPARAQSLVGDSKVELLFALDERSAVFVDHRIGFSCTIPGRQELLPGDFLARPRRDAAVRLRDLPAQIDEEA